MPYPVLTDCVLCSVAVWVTMADNYHNSCHNVLFHDSLDNVLENGCIYFFIQVELSAVDHCNVHFPKKVRRSEKEL